MQILPLHPLLAAEITNFSLDQFEESDWTQIIESLKKYSVLVFRNQEIDNEAQIRFSERLGPLETTKVGTEGAGTKLVFLSNMDSKGELLPVTSRAILNNRANQLWHSDSSFKTVPARATVLRAVKIPPEQGATEYISLRALYQSLPEASKAEIANLWGIHDYSNSRTKIDPDLVTEEEKQALPPVRQPLVLNHGSHGKSLYMGAHLAKIEGVPENTGKALIQQLTENMENPSYIYRHHWQVHDVVVWDNLSVMHRATPFENQKYGRTMIRTAIGCREKLHFDTVIGTDGNL